MVIAKRKCDLHRLARTYIKLFGADSVLVMFYEDLLRNRAAYVERFCNFVQIPNNARHAVGDEARKERPSDLAIRIMRATSEVMDTLLFRKSSRALPHGHH
jgi:hypothetical protein